MSKMTDCFRQRWVGQAAPPTSSSQQAFIAGITGAGGAVTAESGGFLRLLFSNANEVANVRIHFNDKLSFLRGDLISFEAMVRASDAAFASATQVALGMGSAYNADPDVITAAAMFRSKANTSNAVILESDDDVTNIDDVATGLKLLTSWQRFRIEFSTAIKSMAAPGISKGGVATFFMGDARGKLTPVGTTKLFDLSGYALGLQPIFQISKTSSTNAHHLDIKYVEVEYKVN